MDGTIMHSCYGLPEDFNCDQCPYAWDDNYNPCLSVGPCGQQNCWYGCVVCQYNHMEEPDCPYYEEDA